MARKKTPKRAVMKLGEMFPAGWNPRTISDEAKTGLRKSIERYGLVQPLVWNKRSKHLVGGHQRYAILLEDHGENYKVEVVVVDLSLVEDQRLNVTLNNPNNQGEFTADLPGLLETLKKSNEDVFEDLMLDTLMVADQKPPPTDPPVPPKLGKTYKCPNCNHEFKAN